MERPKIRKLSQHIVNQIAAGEVVERPASIVKELVDNSIDAKSTRIDISVKSGGINYIEVSDNGEGIPKENMPSIFDSHSTSKISKIEDLNTLISMGFRGEALSSISSVSVVSLASKYIADDVGYELLFNEDGKSTIKKKPKESGTTIKVENIFYNIPARKKYLKTAQTEYRKIYELLSNYFLIYPNIQFTLLKDGKTIKSLLAVPNSKAGQITKERVEDIVGEGNNFLNLFYSGAGIKINGLIAHPNTHTTGAVKSHIFVNNRPITDRGIVRAVYEGYSRYLPFRQKINFIINISINPELVDVNVHPRKEEVRFENPYRLYSAVEEAVRHSLEKELSFKDLPKDKSITNDFASLREQFKTEKSSVHSNTKQYSPQNIYTSSKPSSVEDSLLFSKELLKDSPNIEEKFLPWEREDEILDIFQIFKKYIVIEFSNEQLWVIDQHAAAERINFEKLLAGKNSIEIQQYLVPIEIKLNENETLLLKEQSDFFAEIGIRYEFKKNKIILRSVPVEFAKADFEQIFKEIFLLEDDFLKLKGNLKKKKEDVIATISCHSSIRAGQKLEKEELLNLFKTLTECKNPYSCPHGRPIIWKLTLQEIDSNFERTY